MFSDPDNPHATRADLQGLRSELTGELSTLRAELRSEILGLRSDLKPELASLENHLIAANVAALFAAVGLVLAVLKLA
jgi:hypothetical protein